MIYRVSEIFPTIQGEGCNTGIPMVLVRFQGCNLRCPWCDTKYTWTYLEETTMQLSEEEILAEVQACKGPRWVLLTGGEPTLQNLGPLCTRLRKAGYKIAVETNGTIQRGLYVYDWVCISPKDLADPMLDLKGVDELKFVVAAPEDIEDIDRFLTIYTDQLPSNGGVQVCLQPLSQDEAATKLCFETCIQRNWRMSVQVHKFINVR